MFEIGYLAFILLIAGCVGFGLMIPKAMEIYKESFGE
jgi:hypothetical protein